MDEIQLGFDGKIFSEVRKVLKGCCAGCVVPSGIFKTMQVANGLALPKEASIVIAKEK